MLVVPEHVQAVGLAPMVALRYGTVPVVRCGRGHGRHGVRSRLLASRPHEERNGYAFQHTDTMAIESALERALRLWFDHPAWFRRLMMASMRSDNSWNHPGREYLSVYRQIRVA